MSEKIESVLVSVAMEIILNAGDARLNTEKALKSAKAFDFEAADQAMEAAKECIRLAHVAQTEIIQNEARGIAYEHCLLFTHAQDTLMTINSEVKLAKEMIEMFQIIDNKISSKGE